MAESVLESAGCAAATSGLAPAVITVIRGTAELAQIRATWESWHQHPNSDIDFYLTILSQRPEIIRPHIMVAHRGGSPVALLVGRIEQRRLAFKLGYLTLLRPKVRVLTLPFGGLLGNGSSENCDVLVSEVMKSLGRGEADLAVFEPMDTRSPLSHSARTLPAWICRDYCHTAQVHRSMDLFGDAEAFRLSLSPKARKNLRWQAKKLLSDFPDAVKIASYASPADLPTMIDEVESVAKVTYQRGLGVGFLNDSEMQARLQLEAERGWMRGYVLHLGNKPCAFWLGTIYGDTFHSCYMGYDPAFAKHSPGSYLVTRVIEDLCDGNRTRVLRQLDFGMGDAQYKQVLGTDAREESGLWICAPSAAGLFLNFARTSLGFIDSTARRILGRTDMLPRVKAAWRKFARRQSPQVGTPD